MRGSVKETFNELLETEAEKLTLADLIQSTVSYPICKNSLTLPKFSSNLLYFLTEYHQR